MTNEVDIFKDSNKLAVSNRTDGFSHTVTGSSTTSKRISIKGGMFRLIVNGQELGKNSERHLDVVLVNASTSVHRMFFKEEYKQGEKMPPPVCWSTNAKAPDESSTESQSKTCECCPQNIKGSGPSNTKACRYSRRIAVVMANKLDGDIFQVTLPALSIFGNGDDQGRPLHEYTDFLKTHNECLGSVVTRMFFDPDSPAPKVRFRAITRLEDEQFELIQKQGASDEAKRAVVLTVAKKEEQSEESLPAAFQLTEQQKAEIAKPKTESVEQEPIPEPVKRSNTQILEEIASKPQEKQKPTEPKQLDIFPQETPTSESPKSDTDEVSLDDLVSDWQ